MGYSCDIIGTLGFITLSGDTVAGTLSVGTRGRTDKKLTSTLVIRKNLSFELADIFLKYGSLLLLKTDKKLAISILIANDEANMTP